MLSIEEAKEKYAAYVRAARNATDPAEKDKYEQAAQTLKDRIVASGEIGMGESAVEGALQGATFGFSDELAGVRELLQATFSDEGFGDAYERGRDLSRAEADIAREANPGTFAASEIASGMLIPGGAALGGARALRTASRLGALGRASAAGAGAGAVQGLGYSEGEDAGEIAADTASGAALGAVATPLIGGATKKIAEGATQLASGARRALAPKADDVAKSRARRILQDEGITSVDQARTRLDELGPEGTLADLGPTARQEGVAVAKSGGEARRIAETAVQGRQRGQEARLQELVQEKVDPKWTDYRGFIKQLDAERVAQADEAYTAAYARGIRPTQEMASVLEKPSAKRAMKQAAANMEDELDSGVRGLSADGEISTRLIDETMRELRDKAGKAMRDGKRNKARRLMALEREIKREAFRSNPDLERAMNVYRGAEELKEAAEFGVDVLSGKRRVRDYLDIAEDFSASEEDAFRVGLLQGMMDKLEDKAWSQDSGRSLIPNSRVQNILRSIFNKGDEDQLDEMVRVIEREMDFQGLRNRVVGGSPTAEIQASQGSRIGRQDQGMIAVARDIFEAIAGDDPDFARLTREEYAELAKIMFGKVSDEDLQDIILPTLRTKVTAQAFDDPLPMISGMAATTSGNRDEGKRRMVQDVGGLL